MEFLLALIVIILLIITLGKNPKNDLKSLFNIIEALGQEIHSLRKEIGSLEHKIDDLKSRPQEGPGYSSIKIVSEPEPVKKPEPQKQPQPETIIEPIPELEIKEEIKIVINSEITEKIFTPTQPEKENAVFIDDYLLSREPVASFSQPGYQKETVPGKESSESWISKNPDLEKFIGENLINKIGIAILVLGIAFFVKYAIDQNWINEAGRVAIGMGCGAILVGLAHYMRNSYRSFSSVLAGGGIAVFYFTIAFAYHQYHHLMSQTAAFVIMVIITAFAVALSVLYDKLELAVIASIGGFITPFLVSNGDGNYIALFSYLVILNLGQVSLSWFKRWPLINIIALFFTIIIYGSWLGYSLADNKLFSYPVALAFASIYYLIFIIMNMVNQLRNKLQFKAFDFFILVLISFWYYAVGMVLMHHWHNGAYMGLFTLSAGIINLALAWIVFKSGKADRNLLYLLIGLTATFVTLTIPIQLHGHAITMFWSAEIVLLYWLYSHSGIKTFKQSSALLIVLTLFSLIMDWNNELSNSTRGLALIFSDIKGIATNVVAIASLVGYSLLVKKSKDTEFLPGISNKNIHVGMMIVAISVLFISCIFGVNLCFRSLTQYDIPNVYHRAITELFALTIILLMQTGRIRVNAMLQFVLLIGCFLFYAISNNYITNVRDEVLTGHFHYFHLYFHWLDSLLMVALFYKTISGIRNNMDVFGGALTGISIAICFMILAFLSVEVQQLYILIGYNKNNTAELNWQYGKAGLSALWGICSFALMWLGMKHKQKTLRIISLTIFSIVLLKLFIFDISGISEGGKIFAFILLGVLLLTVSFMYQKLKKIIIDDNKKE